MKRNFATLGIVFGIFIFVSMWQEVGRLPTFQEAGAISGMLIIVALILPVCFSIFIAVSLTSTASDTIKKIKEMLTEKK